MISGDYLGLSPLLVSRFMGSKISVLGIYVTPFLLVSWSGIYSWYGKSCARFWVTEQRWAVRWILEQIVKSLKGVELHPDADEKASTRAELLSALRFRISKNKIDKSPPPYIVIWTKLIGGWPSIVNGGCRFALQAWRKFLDQVRILAKSKILWNHGRIFLCPGSGEELYSTFGVDTELLRDSIWTEPSWFYPAWQAWSLIQKLYKLLQQQSSSKDEDWSEI